MNDAIEDGVGVGWISDELVPFGHGELAGDDGGPAAVAFFQDFEEVVTSGGVDGSETEVIDMSSWTLPRLRRILAYRPSPRASASSVNSFGMR
jgi:hypothetical protein